MMETGTKFGTVEEITQEDSSSGNKKDDENSIGVVSSKEKDTDIEMTKPKKSREMSSSHSDKSIKRRNKKKRNRCCRCLISVRNVFIQKQSEGDYVQKLLGMNFMLRAIRFLPALVITYLIELLNSANIGGNENILTRHFSILILIPVISAIAGNIGLQTSSSVTSYINIFKDKNKGNNKKVSFKLLIRKYLSYTLLHTLFFSFLISSVSFLMPKPKMDSSDQCAVAHALILFIGTLLNMIIASIAGLSSPYLLNLCGFDPSSGAGPFETALQDVVGSICIVAIAKAILASWIPIMEPISPILANNCTL